MNKSLLILTTLLGYTLTQTANTNFNTQSRGCMTNYPQGSSYNGCQTCHRGDYQFQVNYNTFSCQRCTPGCDQCNNANTCLQCSNAHFLTAISTCTACHTGCSTCSSQTFCSTCLPTFFKDISNLCQKCTIGCQTCENPYQCVTCSQEYFKNKDQKCSACGLGCNSCKSESVCDSCKWDFNNKEGTCVEKSAFMKFLIIGSIILGIVALCAGCCYWISKSSNTNSNNYSPTPQQPITNTGQNGLGGYNGTNAGGNWNNANAGWNQNQGGWNANNGGNELSNNVRN